MIAPWMLSATRFLSPRAVSESAGEVETNVDSSASRPQILCVDDDVQVLRALRRQLESLYDITLAQNPAECLQHLGGKEFDVIISDLRMPGVEGVGFPRSTAASGTQYRTAHPYGMDGPRDPRCGAGPWARHASHSEAVSARCAPAGSL